VKVILVTGPRTYDAYSSVQRALADLEPGDLVVHGKARGLDQLASNVAHEKRAPTIEVPYVGWLRGAGGPARNAIMVDIVVALGARQGTTVECRAFGTGMDPGTQDCAKRAVQAGIPVRWCD
jgi:hypothetical protein